jgi:hypothetical protein
MTVVTYRRRTLHLIGGIIRVLNSYHKTVNSSTSTRRGVAISRPRFAADIIEEAVGLEQSTRRCPPQQPAAVPRVSAMMTR